MERLNFLLNRMMIIGAETTNPMAILGKKIDASQGSTMSFKNKVSVPLGVPELWWIVIGTGVLLAVLVIIIALIKLLVVNYPKTVNQVKQKVVHAFFVVIALSSLAFIFDQILKLVQAALGMTFT